MSIAALVNIVHTPGTDQWRERNESAFASLFGGSNRYSKAAEKAAKLRAPSMVSDDSVPFAAYIHPENPNSGAYSGLSFVIFPIDDGPCLIGLVAGTQGLGADEAILGRPGHARKTTAIADWLNAEYGHGERVAWSKHDPTRTDIKVPAELQQQWSDYSSVFNRYGKEMYCLFRPTDDRTATRDAISAMLDLMMIERGYPTMMAAFNDAQAIQMKWLDFIVPQVTGPQVQELLEGRRFVILQGPPGTGKTKLALDLLASTYKGRGITIQFHPNTTYENFIGGLAPIVTKGNLGLQFEPTPGFLLRAIEGALANPNRNYLLHIDEINRADLGKILGEAILLLEWQSQQPRSVTLPYDFGEPFGSQLTMPENLHILGTMNTADRSIAALDIAVRRRFGFLAMWPDMRVVQQNSGPLMQKAFSDLLSIFVESAGEDSFQLLPGHAYFLDRDDDEARGNLKSNLAPLLEEYLSQGYVTGFAESIRTYVQWLRGL